jgi:DNA-binding IclR family transcriptional regulator
VVDTLKNHGIQVIARAAAILRLLGKETGGLSLGQIAKAVDLPRSTVQRIVGALSNEGFVTKGDGSGRIQLGAEIQSLAQATAVAPRDRLRPVMEHLAQSTGETVDLAVLQGGKMLFLEQIEGQHRLRTVSRIGDAFPLTCTANGKAALAAIDLVAATQMILAEIRQDRTPDRQLSDILAEIERIRDGALATDEDEHTEGISAIGFAIPDASGEVFAISIPVPSGRFQRQRAELVKAMEEARSSLPGAPL